MTETGSSGNRRLAIILFADVAGYSRLMRADEEQTLTDLRAHLAELVAPVVERFHGRIVKLVGDGVMAEFGSAVEALTGILMCGWSTGFFFAIVNRLYQTQATPTSV